MAARQSNVPIAYRSIYRLNIETKLRLNDITKNRLELCATVMDCQMYTLYILIAMLCLPRITIALSSRLNNLGLILSVSMRQT